ncbi:hypothetical protein [Streptomyces sp. I05A-00742]|uniref:hypothetical protein n=1 Tax=Streptomyces sp. I05A-00742 TaxID=2732853 RepID=UPI001488E059|nr:hypothetical protein [Streptomyces sp. I05A-00742]
MVSKFWETAGGKLAERWTAASVSAVTFALGGTVAWAHAGGGYRALRRPAAWLAGQPAAAQAGVLLAALLVITACGSAVQRLTPTALRVCAGHWPAVSAPVRERLVRRQHRRYRSVQDRFQQLSPAVYGGTATPEERAEHGRLTARLRRFPAPDALMPTRLGNVLRAAESRPTDKYGLDAVAVWPHLWLLLPDTTRKEIAHARLALETSAAACVWGVAFLGFTPWSPWAVPAGLAVAVIARAGWLPARAETYADLVEAAFDLHRATLYRQLRWPLPTDPRDEYTQGRRVTTYLVRGLRGTDPVFTPVTPAPDAEGGTGQGGG